MEKFIRIYFLAKFVNHFAFLHPEVVKLVIAGACSKVGILPLKEITEEKQ